MVSLIEALQQTRQAEEEAIKRKEEIKRAEAQARRIKVGGTIKEQLKYGSNLPEVRVESKAQQQKALQQIGVAKKELSSFQQAIAGRKAEISAYQEQQAQIEKYNADLATARKFASSGKFPFTANKQVRELYGKLRQGLEVREKRAEAISSAKEQGLTPLFVGGELKGFESSVTQQSFALSDLPSASPQSLESLKSSGLITVEQKPLSSYQFQELGFSQTPVTSKSYTSQKFLDLGFEQSVMPKSIVKDNSMKQITFFKDVETSIISDLVGAPQRYIEFGKDIISSPFETITSIPGNIKKTATNLRELNRQAPGKAVGTVIGELILFKGTGKLIKLGETGLELGTARLSTKFRGINTRTLAEFGGREESFIGGIPEIGGIGEIGLIPEKIHGPSKIGGLSTPPTIRGAFGYPMSEIKSFIGEVGPVTTSARDLFSLTKSEVTLKPGIGGFGLFATPPKEGMAFTRVSRFGLSQPEATLSDILGGDFTFKKVKPQIVIFPKEIIGREGGFQTKTFTPGELEVTLPPGKIIRRTGEPAVTIIGQRKVPIITAELVDTSGGISNLFGKVRKGEKLSFGEIGKIKKVTGFKASSFLETKPYFSLPRFFSSSLLSTSKQFSQKSSTYKLSQIPRQSRTSLFPKISGFGRISSKTGFSFKTSPPKRFNLMVGGFSGGFSGLPRVPKRFDVPPLKIGLEKKGRLKKVKEKRMGGFLVAPSFTASSLNLRGLFPKSTSIAGADLGILPSNLRFIPYRRKNVRRKRRR